MAYRHYGAVNLTPIWVLLAVNFIILIATFINRDFIFLFCLQPISFLNQPWPIVTSIFVHAGIGNLIVNMFTLFFFCYVLLGGGILGSLFYLILGSPYSIAVGSSGAVFALGGVLAAMRPKIKVFIFPIPVPLPLWTAVIGGFLVLSLFPGIAWQAHFGGLVYGLVAGYFFRRKERRSH